MRSALLLLLLSLLLSKADCFGRNGGGNKAKDREKGEKDESSEPSMAPTFEPTQEPTSEPSTSKEPDVDVEAKIVGGVAALKPDFPFFVQGKGCGGILVWEDVVLTAAHCRRAYLDGSVLIGATSSRSDEGRAQWVSIQSDLVSHPDFDYESMENDFMLFKVDKVTDPTLARQLRRKRVTLNTDNSFPRDGDPVTVTGFGTTSAYGSPSSVLLKVTVDKVPDDECDDAYRGNIDRTTMFCAGVEGGGYDSCQGDSGGPLLAANNVLVGLVSWGFGCAQPGYYGVYSRVSGRIWWIREQICNLSDNPPDYC